jgi:prepilin signal peptidase PulO-like enzyme (type II secretory pathway)
MEYLFYFVLLFIGASIGSFLNAAAFRLANGLDIVRARSACIKCKKTIAWYDLVPVLSYLQLRGKCRSCGEKISMQYWLVELVLALLFLSSGLEWISGNSSALSLFRDLFVQTVLVFLFLFDLRYYLLPDIVTIPSIIIIFGINLYLGVSLSHLILAILIGAGFFAAQFLISKGTWIGGGDIRLGALMGAILSWPGIILGLFSSYIIGSIVAMGLVLSGKSKFGAKIPFGTFLAIGTFISLWWGDQLIEWYLGYLTL